MCDLAREVVSGPLGRLQDFDGYDFEFYLALFRNYLRLVPPSIICNQFC